MLSLIIFGKFIFFKQSTVCRGEQLMKIGYEEPVVIVPHHGRRKTPRP